MEEQENKLNKPTVKFLMEFNRELDDEINIKAAKTRSTKKNVILQALKDSGFKNVGHIIDKRKGDKNAA
tara:strand:- start:570 stop:776 length:207 start_codon:yes stop_codon:yes gene_type:complete